MHVSQRTTIKPAQPEMLSAAMVAGSPFMEQAPVAIARLPLQVIASLIGHAAFSTEERKWILSSLQSKALERKRNRHGYDINASFCTAGHEGKQHLPEGVIRLRSRNFGYDFALMKVANGHTLLGLPKQAVQIYISRLGENEYAFLQIARNITKALAVIDKMYCRAAEVHLA